MPESQVNGRKLRYSPMKGENNDAVKLRVPSKHQCCTWAHTSTPLPPSPPLQIKHLQQQWASSNEEERVQSTRNNSNECTLEFVFL